MENISIIGDGQGKLAAYCFMPENECRYILIICHGFRGAKENGGRIFTFAEKLNKLGLGVLAFDFSGSGASDGDFANISLSSQVSDLRQVIDYVDSNYNRQLILLGRSFGGVRYWRQPVIMKKWLDISFGPHRSSFMRPLPA